MTGSCRASKQANVTRFLKMKSADAGLLYTCNTADGKGMITSLFYMVNNSRH